MCELDVFVGNFSMIDWELYGLWLSGRSVAESAAIFVRDNRHVISDFHVGQDIIVSDMNDNFRLFALLETALLSSQNLSPLQLIDGQAKAKLVESYHSLDSSFCREIVGRKLNSRLRKELDEVAEKSGILPRSCRRQFDNIKRIFKAVEDMPPNQYVGLITGQFGLSKSLAEKYAAIIFAASFRIELSKKKLAHLKFDQIRAVCLMLVNDWGDKEDLQEPNLDREFLASLRDIKGLLERDKEHRNAVMSRLKDRIDANLVGDLESNFKTVTRNVVSVGVSLSNSKDVRDIFIHLVEKVVDPLKQLAMSIEDVDLLLKTYGDVITENVVLMDNDVTDIVGRFMKTLRPAVLAIYEV